MMYGCMQNTPLLYMIVFVCEGRVSAYIPTSFVLLYIFFLYYLYTIISIYISIIISICSCQIILCVLCFSWVTEEWDGGTGWTGFLKPFYFQNKSLKVFFIYEIFFFCRSSRPLPSHRPTPLSLFSLFSYSSFPLTKKIII